MVETVNKPQVLVTGITGYIGSWVALMLLEQGYKVRGSVRDPSNQAKLDPLKKSFGPEKFDKLEIVKGDLLDAESMREAVRGCQWVAHIASPFVFEEPTDENELIRPAVEGTLSVLRACKEFGVSRVCVTSSVASVTSTDPKNEPDEFTEEHWSDPENNTSMSAYAKSKTLAEKAAWKFMEDAQKDGC